MNWERGGSRDKCDIQMLPLVVLSEQYDLYQEDARGCHVNVSEKSYS